MLHRKSDIGSIVSVLSAWCDNCDNMIKGIESQVDKVNVERQQHLSHKNNLEAKINEMKQQLKNQPGDEDGCADSRMDTERMSVGGERCKKVAKGKGIDSHTSNNKLECDDDQMKKNKILTHRYRVVERAKRR